MALIKVKFADLAAIKDQIMILDGGQRSGEVIATGVDGKPMIRQMDMKPIALHVFPSDHIKFKFINPGKVRYDFGRCLKAVETKLKVLDQKRTELIEMALATQRGEEKYKNSTDLEAEYATQFHKDYRAALNEEIEIDFRQVEIGHLGIEENSIPVEVFSVLMDVAIKDDEQHDKK